MSADYRSKLEKVLADTSDDEYREDKLIAIAALALLDKLDAITSEMDSLSSEVHELAAVMRGEE